MKSKIDYLIVGAGAAGLQLSYFLHKNGRNYLVLEANETAGSFWQTFPRHRKMISINKVYTGYQERALQLRWDWNSLLCDDDSLSVSRYTQRYFPDAEDYHQYLGDFAKRFQLNIQYNTPVAKISKSADGFTVVDAQNQVYDCKRLIIAVGVSKPYIPPIPGIENTENYFDFSFDPKNYVNQRVLIIGKGTSGFETANHLIETTRLIHLCSPESIKLAWQTHFVGHLRAINTDFLDTYLLKGQNAVLDAEIEKIDFEEEEYQVQIRFTHAEDQRAILAYDRVLCCTGFQFDKTIFAENCQPELKRNDRLPAMTSQWEATNIPDMYFAGTLMQVRDYQKTHSNVIHGFRSNIKALSAFLEQKYHGKALPYYSLSLNSVEIADQIIESVSTSAGIFLQQGFLGDLLIIDQAQSNACYYQGLPVDYIHDSDFGQQAQYYTITMEFGHAEGDPFQIDREKDQDKANLDFYLHPIVRRFQGNTLLYEHHISEHLENDWRIGKYPGERPLIRALEFTGDADSSLFYHGYRQKLLDFLDQELCEVSTC